MFGKKKVEKKLEHDCKSKDDYAILGSGILVNNGQVTGFTQKVICTVCGCINQKIYGTGSHVDLPKKFLEKTKIIKRLK